MPRSSKKPRLNLHIGFANDRSLGPDKVRLLELIEKTGSISAAGRALGIAYHPAWDLIDELNRIFGEPVIATQCGGPNGGGAKLTKLGTTASIARWRRTRATSRRKVWGTWRNSSADRSLGIGFLIHWTQLQALLNLAPKCRVGGALSAEGPIPSSLKQIGEGVRQAALSRPQTIAGAVSVASCR